MGDEGHAAAGEAPGGRGQPGVAAAQGLQAQAEQGRGIHVAGEEPGQRRLGGLGAGQAGFGQVGSLAVIGEEPAGFADGFHHHTAVVGADDGVANLVAHALQGGRGQGVAPLGLGRGKGHGHLAMVGLQDDSEAQFGLHGGDPALAGDVGGQGGQGRPFACEGCWPWETGPI